jgi:hypothetical protein
MRGFVFFRLFDDSSHYLLNFYCILKLEAVEVAKQNWSMAPLLFSTSLCRLLRFLG